MTWQYENILYHAHVVRTWKIMDYNKDWVSYDCFWPGPSSGIIKKSFYDEGGLASGTWEMTITVNDVVLLRQQLFIQGDWINHDSYGNQNSC